MTWPGRIIVIVVAAVAVRTAPLGYAQQTQAEQKVQAFVEGLRGRVSEAAFDNGHYHHAGITIDVPGDWLYGGTIPAALPTDDTAHWTDPRTGIELYVWLSTRRSAPASISEQLANVVANKTLQRQQENVRKWVVRPESIQAVVVEGRKGLTALADFESRAGDMRVELMTWVITPVRRFFFFATMRPDQLAGFQPEFVRVVQSVQFP
jgi:hypothetical protein